MLPGIIHESIEAHGGEKLWKEIAAVEAVLTVRGALFLLKRRQPLDRVLVRASTREPFFAFCDFPAPGLTAELTGRDEVRIVDRGGNVKDQRRSPREAFRRFSRFFSWDDLDFTYFGGYATWNYLVAPFLFLRSGFSFDVLPPYRGSHGTWERVRATFPDDIPTHCREQVFHFDEARLLRRLDYTAEVVGGWAHAAHLCDGYQDFSGLKVATKRRVYPLFHMKQPLPFPLLVTIDVHSVKLRETEGSGH